MYGDLMARPKKYDDTAEQRFWSRVRKTDGCWTWEGPVGSHGYGMFYYLNSCTVSHRWSYEALVGPIPEGHQLDHLCRNTVCCRPGHLEPVLPGENLRRATPYRASRNRSRCKNGHELVEGSFTIRIQDGNEAFRCKICDAEKSRRYKERKKA